MATKYTSSFTLMADVLLYSATATGAAITLSMIPLLAKTRFTWFVNNWNTLFPRFKKYANGDQELESILANFDNVVKGYQLGNTQNPFDIQSKLESFQPFLSQVKASELTLTPAEQQLIATEQQRVANFTVETFQDMVHFLRQQIALQAWYIGLGDADAARVVGIQGATQQVTATIDTLSIVNDLTGVEQYIEGLIISQKLVGDRPPNLLKVANQNIAGGQVSIKNTYRSYLAFPFEISLEHMAQKYLGDQKFWYELVTVNNLQPPYVDEVGQKYPLLAPGAANNVVISADRKSDVHVGTAIKIGSFKVREEARIVESISYNNDNTMVLFLSDAQDLTKFKLTDSAFVRIYQPHTVNSGSFVQVPLDIAPTAKNPVAWTPKADALRRLDQAFIKFGFDIARDETTNDLIIDSNGNFAVAAGLQNMRQAIRSALRTVIGELPFHPGYGVNINIGGRFYGTRDEGLILANLIATTLKRDPRFQAVQVANLATTNTGLAITLLVSISGFNKPLPLSFVS
jgi:hypothetical protein